MLVNSVVFWMFFLVVLIPYFSVMRENFSYQNVWLLLASYFFYGYADWRMVPLLLVATAVFFFLGLRIGKTSNVESREDGGQGRRRLLLTVGAVAGVGMLLYFKYMNFFIEQFATLFSLAGMKTNWSSFNIVVPIGISFFTFKLIAYLVEVYKGNMEPVNNFVTFATYVAFFPTIMSGPIDSPRMFIPQLGKSRQWENGRVAEGAKRVLWGLFLKMCIADKVSGYTDAVFDNAYHHNATSIIVASVLYTFQIYADFSGYSEMAIGTSQVLGIRVTENFLRPYFSQNVGEFWRRWHASLMNWFRDYVYFPLGGSRCAKWKMYRNTLAVFLVSGLWHGANWTFVFWGVYHGVLVCLQKLFGRKQPKGVAVPPRPFFRRYANALIVFVLVTIGWQVFRCHSFAQFAGLWQRMFLGFGPVFKSWALMGFIPIFIMLMKELKDEEGWNIHLLHSSRLWVQVVSFALLTVFVLYFGELEGGSFIYFQF